MNHPTPQASLAAPTLVGFGDWSRDVARRLEQALDQALPAADLAPQHLHQAMRYAVLDGGKRVRPLLVHAAAESFHGHAQTALAAAMAVELIHAYSLVHDDMPEMDNDALRRGRPTVHVAYGQATALLVGDALQSAAFEIIAAARSSQAARLVHELSLAAGSRGMAGGQAIDLASVGMALSVDALEQMHRMKTGALLRCAVRLGALSGDVPSDAELAALDDYAAAIGLAFQVVDDVLDAEADTTTLGKTAGKDAAADKPTYVSMLGLAASKALANQLREDAFAALAQLHDHGRRGTQRLADIADFIVLRSH